jgi:predicted MFS family arabinose efflux permease
LRFLKAEFQSKNRIAGEGRVPPWSAHQPLKVMPMSPQITPALPASFHRLAWSNLAAQAAEQVALAAAPLIAVLSLEAGTGETGLLQMAQSLPFLLLSLPAGVLADRASRRHLMIAAETIRAVALLALPALAIVGWLSLPLLAVLGFLAATGTVVFSVAAPALVPALVPRASLAQANGRLELARATAFAAGPALAGALVGWAGASPTFVLAAGLSLLAVFLLVGVAEPPRAPHVPRHPLRDLQEGARFAWTHLLIRPILLTAVVWNLSWFVLQAAYVPYAVHELGLNASTIGMTLATYGVGMVAGAVLAPRLTRALPFGMVVALGPLVSVAAAAAMIATLCVPTEIWAGLSFFLFGAGPIVWTISSTTLRQAVTPDTLLGRVSALFMTASAGARPVGALIGAALGASYGPSACIVLAAIGFVVQALVIMASPVRILRHLPDAKA